MDNSKARSRVWDGVASGWVNTEIELIPVATFMSHQLDFSKNGNNMALYSLYTPIPLITTLTRPIKILKVLPLPALRFALEHHTPAISCQAFQPNATLIPNFDAAITNDTAL